MSLKFLCLVTCLEKYIFVSCESVSLENIVCTCSACGNYLKKISGSGETPHAPESDALQLSHRAPQYMKVGLASDPLSETMSVSFELIGMKSAFGRLSQQSKHTCIFQRVVQ